MSVTIRALDGLVRVELATSDAERALAAMTASSPEPGSTTVRQVLAQLRTYCAAHELAFRLIEADARPWSMASVVVG